LESFFDKYMVASSHRRKAEFSASTEHGTRYVGRTPAVLGPAKFQTKVQHLDAKRSEARSKAGRPSVVPELQRQVWSDGRPVHPSRAIGQANNGGYARLEIANPVETVGAIPVGHPS
jgi:hypothetical protein